MLELAAPLLAELRAGRSFAAVTVVGLAGPAARGVGATIAYTDDGRVLGSLAGGCSDGDALLLAADVLATGRSRTARLGASGADGAPAITCGGSVDVVAVRIDPTDAVVAAALRSAAAGRATRLALALEADGARGTDGASPAVGVEPAASVDFSSDLLILAAPARPRLLLVGANEHAAALCAVAAAAGWAVTVCDPWGLLVTPERFPTASGLVADMPHEWLARLDPDELDAETTAVCVLSHDERIDVPALRVALTLPVGFVGAMGSRTTSDRRRALLAAAGVTAAALDRLRMPLGLDLGGRSPGETAIAMLAEIVAARHGGSGAPLRDGTGPLHRRVEVARVPVRVC